MSYFPHAFQKTFVMNDFASSGASTEVLEREEGGFFDAKTFTSIPIEEASFTAHPRLFFAMGSYSGTENDLRGRHGGYMESFKSEIIHPRHVHRVWKAMARGMQAHIVQVGWDTSTDGSIPKFYCGQTYHLRIDVKGTRILRTLGHNLYQIFDVRTKCCAGTTPELVDPVTIMLAFAKQINESPILSQFISTMVVIEGDVADPDSYEPLTDPEEIANTKTGLRLTAGFADSTFDYCSFDPRDYYEVEPVIIASAELIDDTGYPCSGFKQLSFTELEEPAGYEGLGENILREFILNNEERQDPFPWTPRKKELNLFGDLMRDVVNRYALYDSYYILHSTPRKYNPSGVHNNDQYLLRICIQQGHPETLEDFEEWMTTYFGTVGVVVEDLS